jgi:penicillin-binding protein 1B
MKKAVTLNAYSDVKPFTQPEGVVDVQLDKVTNRLATPSCPDDYTIAFIAGTEPHDTCDQSTGVQGFFSRIFGGNSEKALPPATTSGNPQADAGVQSDEEAKKKKSFFGKIVGVFKGDSGTATKNDKSAAAPSKTGDGSAPPP